MVRVICLNCDFKDQSKEAITECANCGSRALNRIRLNGPDAGRSESLNEIPQDPKVLLLG